MKSTLTGIVAAVFLFGAGCIRPNNYHPDAPAPPNPQTDLKKPTFFYKYPPPKVGRTQPYGCGYFKDAEARLAYVEFDARGSKYGNVQRDAALQSIADAQKESLANGSNGKITLYVFVHGWKNNASENSGNVWGFRRFLSSIARLHCDTPVVGVYIGWPGASLKNDLFLSFWNREPIADDVGNGDLTDVLRRLLKAAKGDDYSGDSVAVVIGHSFGGIVLEHAATRLIREQFDKLNGNAKSGEQVTAGSPADLFVLVNEAGAAAIARPLLLDLKHSPIEYSDSHGHLKPLILSVTSTGDLATKVAFPGAEALSSNRGKPDTYNPPDEFAQTSSKPYDLLTAANMPALHSHQIVLKKPSMSACQLSIKLDDIEVPQCLTGAYKRKPGKTPEASQIVEYCMNELPGRRNDTAYWIMQMPQVFVPDHSAVFQDYFLNLLQTVMGNSGLTIECPKSEPMRALLPPAAGMRRAASAGRATERPSLKRGVEKR